MPRAITSRGHSDGRVAGLFAAAEPAQILVVFNAGTDEAIDVSQWIAGQPVDVLAVNSGKAAAAFEAFPKRDVFITKA